MSQKTNIEWCDSTVNFWRGCDKVSAGCANCYITTTTPFRVSGQKHGDPRVKSANAVKEALALNRKPFICDECGSDKMLLGSDGRIDCAKCGSNEVHRRRIFSLSLGDWLDPKVPGAWLFEMLSTIFRCDQVEWILCTKRPELFSERLREACREVTIDPRDDVDRIFAWMENTRVPHNVTLLASVENQAMADKRIPELLAIPAARRGLSMEPLLGPVEICSCMIAEAATQLSFAHHELCHRKGLDLLIVGGESGQGARPCNVDWIRGVVRQGQAAGVPVFVKQLGAEPRRMVSAD